jgi:hypothetical protein
MKYLLLCSALILAGCNSQQGADNYSFGTKQYEKDSVQVSIVTYESPAKLQKIAKDKYRINSDTLVAFSVLRPPFDKCTIHMVDPTVSYEPEFVGHEFLHCVYGQWHTSNGLRK